MQVLGNYIVTSSHPFQFGPYDFLKPAQAASAIGLLNCLPFLELWLVKFPACQITSRKFSTILCALVESGAMCRFGPHHEVWAGCNPALAKPRVTWADLQTAKIIVILYHLRRLHFSSEKKQQCFRGLPADSTKALQKILDLIKIPDITASSQSLSSCSPGSSALTYTPNNKRPALNLQGVVAQTTSWAPSPCQHLLSTLHSYQFQCWPAFQDG